MNIWTNKSIELANQRNYLDLLFKIYPMSVNLRRELKKKDIDDIKKYFNNKDSKNLLNVLLAQEIFPIKDSYIAYLKRDKSAIDRNPNTVNSTIPNAAIGVRMKGSLELMESILALTLLMHFLQ